MSLRDWVQTNSGSAAVAASVIAGAWYVGVQMATDGDIQSLREEIRAVGVSVSDSNARLLGTFSDLRVTVASLGATTESMRESVDRLSESADGLDGTVDMLAGTTVPFLVACIAETNYFVWMQGNLTRPGDNAAGTLAPPPPVRLPAPCEMLQELGIPDFSR